jgi:tRNA(adenine34) deaminase
LKKMTETETETETEVRKLLALREKYMGEALALARQAGELGEVPIGAIIVRDGEIIGRGYNQTICAKDPTAHAEIVALKDAAARISNHRIVNADMYVTIEPCTMCAGALVHARLATLFFGAPEPRAGAVISSATVLDNPGLNHHVTVIPYIRQAEAAELMSNFFKQKRREK